MYLQSPETDIQLQPHQQRSFESVYTTATDYPSTLGVQSSEKSTKIIIEYRATIIRAL